MAAARPDGVTTRGGQRPRERKGREALPWNEPPKADVIARFAERDAREAMDDRTLAERWLGDPPFWRSALSIFCNTQRCRNKDAYVTKDLS